MPSRGLRLASVIFCALVLCVAYTRAGEPEKFLRDVDSMSTIEIEEELQVAGTFLAIE